jgi:hypothetical protein
VRIEVLHEKNASSTGYNVGLDAVDVFGSLAQAMSPIPPSTRYEQTAAQVSYVGPWLTVNGTGFSNGSYAALTATGSASFEFRGTRVRWFTVLGPACGIAHVVLDGSAPVSVDLYSGSYAYKSKVWNIGRTEGHDPHGDRHLDRSEERRSVRPVSRRRRIRRRWRRRPVTVNGW